MGAWIEIMMLYQNLMKDKCRTPRWVRGLKSVLTFSYNVIVTSHPTMGAWIEIQYLKDERYRLLSHPTMGAWIEIVLICVLSKVSMSHPTMGAWIEISPSADALMKSGESHPTMGAWIEILPSKSSLSITNVAPHDGCVD